MLLFDPFLDNILKRWL